MIVRMFNWLLSLWVCFLVVCAVDVFRTVEFDVNVLCNGRVSVWIVVVFDAIDGVLEVVNELVNMLS